MVERERFDQARAKKRRFAPKVASTFYCDFTGKNILLWMLGTEEGWLCLLRGNALCTKLFARGWEVRTLFAGVSEIIG